MSKGGVISKSNKQNLKDKKAQFLAHEHLSAKSLFTEFFYFGFRTEKLTIPSFPKR